MVFHPWSLDWNISAIHWKQFSVNDSSHLRAPQGVSIPSSAASSKPGGYLMTSAPVAMWHLVNPSHKQAPAETKLFNHIGNFILMIDPILCILITPFFTHSWPDMKLINHQIPTGNGKVDRRPAPSALYGQWGRTIILRHRRHILTRGVRMGGMCCTVGEPWLSWQQSDHHNELSIRAAIFTQNAAQMLQLIAIRIFGTVIVVLLVLVPKVGANLESNTCNPELANQNCPHQEWNHNYFPSSDPNPYMHYGIAFLGEAIACIL